MNRITIEPQSRKGRKEYAKQILFIDFFASTLRSLRLA